MSKEFCKFGRHSSALDCVQMTSHVQFVARKTTIHRFFCVMAAIARVSTYIVPGLRQYLMACGSVQAANRSPRLTLQYARYDLSIDTLRAKCLLLYHGAVTSAPVRPCLCTHADGLRSMPVLKLNSKRTKGRLL